MENFVVSARKYRPATFEMVVGQSHITSTLKNAIERGQLAHAYLFCGPRGVGKTTCARIFAKSINCLDPQNGCEPCGRCESCVGFESGRSMNIHELDAASNNSVEDIRSLIDQVRIIPQVGRYALFIIDEVHMLSTAAFNAFLKTLEEPPAHAIFILATTERHKILPTILSRCQCYDFNRIRVEDGAEYLRYIAQKEGVSIDDESLNLIAQKADGGMRDALSMFDKAVSFGGSVLDFKVVSQTLGVVDYDTYFALTEAMLEGDYQRALILFDGVLGSGFSASSMLSGLARHMRDLLVAQDEGTMRLMELTGTLMERYRTQAVKCSVEFLFGAISVITEIDGELKRSSNQRLLVELGLMKISGLGKKKIEPTPSLPALEAEVEVAVKEVEVAERVEVAEKVEQVAVAEEVEAEKPKRPTPLFSLQSELKASSSEEEKGEIESGKRREDPEAERKIREAQGSIIGYMTTARPRFKPLFESMVVEGSTIRIESPTAELELEIRRNETELMGNIVEIAGVDGYIALSVTVNEQMRVKRPIKLEDRILHFRELNPAIVEFTEALDLQVDS